MGWWISWMAINNVAMAQGCDPADVGAALMSDDDVVVVKVLGHRVDGLEDQWGARVLRVVDGCIEAPTNVMISADSAEGLSLATDGRYALSGVADADASPIPVLAVDGCSLSRELSSLTTSEADELMGHSGTCAPPEPTKFSAIWANSGEDKVTSEELRGTADASAVHNARWDGSSITLAGAKNEVVAFNLVMEAGSEAVADVRVEFDTLVGPAGAQITSVPVSADEVFDWTERSIELFYVEYLQITGLSKWHNTYDERHIPEKLRRPFTGEGFGTGEWTDRPNHDTHYPEIATPMELVGTFDVDHDANQSVWVDIAIPADAAAGLHSGNLRIYEGGSLTQTIGVDLEVHDFALPDEPSLATMLWFSPYNINLRYLGVAWPYDSAMIAHGTDIEDRHFQLAHRHRISLIGDDDLYDAAYETEPRPEWLPRLDGSLFTAAHGYAGPGTGVGNGVYSIGTYGSWTWAASNETEMQDLTDAWADWFADNSPDTEHFLYLADETNDYAQLEEWAQWIESGSGSGQQLMSFATESMFQSSQDAPSLDIACTTGGRPVIGDPTEHDDAFSYYRDDPTKRAYFYNGQRPWTGTFMTDDDGTALRVSSWAQYKHGIDRWFYWESTYYDNYQGGTGQTDVWNKAHTFGVDSGYDSVLGDTGWLYMNGDGVLFYPGTDTVYPASSYDLEGPIASLRLKYWRRGIQDGDYLTLAAAIDPAAVEAIVDATLPEAMFEYGVDDPYDPSWVRTDISWDPDPDVWEAARADLAAIIESGS